MKTLETYFPIGEAISLLLSPHAEVIFHDLKTGRIAMIYNNLSKRNVGDESLLDETQQVELPDVFAPYYKTNWDGRRMKSVTMTLKNEHQKPIGLLCINLDLSKWEEMHQFIESWLEKIPEEQPEVLFKDDWREKVNTYVTAYLKEHCFTLKTLKKEEKQALVHALHSEGAFQAKNAAVYIADILGISRATIYNYLRGKDETAII